MSPSTGMIRTKRGRLLSDDFVRRKGNIIKTNKSKWRLNLILERESALLEKKCKKLDALISRFNNLAKLTEAQKKELKQETTTVVKGLIRALEKEVALSSRNKVDSYELSSRDRRHLLRNKLSIIKQEIHIFKIREILTESEAHKFNSAANI